jgi:hypothetical protein
MAAEERTPEQLRYEAAEAGRALAAAYDENEMASFHFNLGRVRALADLIYNANAEADKEALKARGPLDPGTTTPYEDLWDNRDKTEGRT